MVTGKLKKEKRQKKRTIMSQATVGPDGSISPAKRSCMFYKLMVASILQDKKLKIPKKFVNKYGNELSSIATLTVPCGRIWLVELLKVNDKLWFHTGWHEFVECHSIRVGYFLVFVYEGKSNFSVHVFDLTTSEIKYPCNTLSSLQEFSQENQYVVPNRKDDSFQKIFGSGTLRPVSTISKNFNENVHCIWTQSMHGASTEKQHLRRDRYDLRKKFCSSRDIGIQFNESDLTSAADGVGFLFSNVAEGRTRKRKRMAKNGVQKMEVKSTRLKITSKTFTRRWRAVTPEEKERAVRAADMFKSDNPFCKVILRPSYVYRGFLLHIPSTFARAYLNQVTGLITLQVSDGKQWPVWCCYNNGSAKLSQGWTEFVWDNNLEEGDVCIFELITTKDIMLKVTIFRVLELQLMLTDR